MPSGDAISMSFFEKVEDKLMKASDNAKNEEDLDKGISVDSVFSIVSELNKRKGEGMTIA
jgi:hypothetical protein